MNVAYLRRSEQFPEALAAAGLAVTAFTRLDALTRTPEAAWGILVGGDAPDAIEDALFDHLNYVRPQFFVDLVDWLLAVCRRHADERFSLLGIRLNNVVDLSARIGRHRTAELVDEFATRLRETVRKTDLTTRTDQRTLWILLPKTECPACTLLLNRIDTIRGNSRQEEGVELHFDTVSYSAPAEQLPGETAGVLLARLAGKLG